MSLAVFRVMVLGLLRDRGALAMTFLVPAVFFVVFAAIFAASSGADYQPRVAVGIDSRSRDVVSFLTELGAGDALTITTTLDGDEEGVRELVRRGRADVGLLVRQGGDEFGTPRFVVFADPARNVAAQILRVNVQRAFAFTFVMPAAAEVALPNLSPAIQTEPVTGERIGANEVAYSAGAVALLFLLLSTVHGAVSLFDEKESGIIERMVAGPAGTRPLVDGKFIYLTVMGFVQISVIFVLAWMVYDVDLPSHMVGWALTTVIAAASAAGLALVLTTMFSTRQQALTFANVTVLILSALGGSMIPRFLMPPLLQQAGWVTPNAWALEAYTSVFWRGDPIAALVLPLSLLAIAGVGGLGLARRNARRLETL